jgi:enoyl-CoA hydratase/carnithine racemase
MYESYRHIAAERRGRILTLTMANPPLNAVNRPLHDEPSHIFFDAPAPKRIWGWRC